MRRVLAIAFVLIILARASVAAAAPPRIGIPYTVPHPVIDKIIAAFEQAVRAKYPEATFIKEHASGNPTEYSPKVLAVLKQNPDLIAPVTTPIAKIALEQARGSIPVVFMGVTDPVSAGLVESLDAPKRATGSSDACPFEGLLDVVRVAMPGARTVAVPYNPNDPAAVFGLGRIKALAPARGLAVIERQIASRDELGLEVRGIAGNADAVLISSDNLLMENPGLVAAAAAGAGRPTFACDETSVEKGAMAGIGVDYADVGRAAGELAVEVLGGKSAGSLPVRVLSSGKISVNKRAACAAGLWPPGALLEQAAVVYEQDVTCDRAAPRSWIWIGVGGLVALGLIGFAIRSRRKAA